MTTRVNQIYVSVEVMFYLRLMSKKMDKDQTCDEVADLTLRYALLADNPQWLKAWEEYQAAKQSSGKRYAEIEKKAIE